MWKLIKHLFISEEDEKFFKVLEEMPKTMRVVGRGTLTMDPKEVYESNNYKQMVDEYFKESSYRKNIHENTTKKSKELIYQQNSKVKIKKENGVWWIISACGNFKEQYVSYKQVLDRLREIK